MEPELISLNEYMRRYKVGYNVVLQMIHNGEIEARKTPGGRYKIKVGGDTVSREMYDALHERCIEAETKLEVLKNILLEGVKNK